MKRDTYFPIILSSWAKKVNSIEIYGIKDTISVEGLTTRAMSLLCQLCTGENSLSEVVKKLTIFWDKESVESLLMFFIKNEIIINARDMRPVLQKLMENPLRFSPNAKPSHVKKMVAKAKRYSIGIIGTVTHTLPMNEQKFSFIEDLLNTRSSCRLFKGLGISEHVLCFVLWSAYGIQSNQIEKSMFYHRTVPSPGALYPLALTLILLQDCGDIEKGVYTIGFTLTAVELSLVDKEVSAYAVSFVDPYIISHATGIIVIQGNYAYSAEKYGNRSALYVPIEAGHVAQNIHLSCQQHSLGTLEIGGFREDALLELTRPPKGYIPIVAVAFGVVNDKEKELEKRRVEIEVRCAYSTPVLKLPYTIVYGRVEGAEDVWSSGKDVNINLATKKLFSEVYEWNVWNEQDSMKRSNMEDIDCVNPVSILSYHHRQYRNSSFVCTPLNKDISYVWVEAEHALNTQKRKYILADLVLFPYHPTYPRYAFSTSSGCAAHTVKEHAITSAVYELIERDAFMIMWMNTLETPEVAIGSLPYSIQKRVEALRRVGFSVVVRDISMGIAPVLMVCAKSAKNDFFCCGIASTAVLIDGLHSALSEVELSILHRLHKSPNKRVVRPRDVQTSEDHRDLYRQRSSVRKTDFLFSKKEKIYLSEIEYRFDSLIKNEIGILEKLSRMGFETFIIDATLWENNIFLPEHRSVIRAIIPELVPLTFGFNQEPFGMKRVFKTPVDLGFISLEQTYSEMNHFPHPLD